jgi:hypothetical protein
MRIVHAKFPGLGIHRLDEGVDAARIVAAQCGGGAVFRAHQGDVQQVAARHAGADGQAGTGELMLVDVGVGDGQHLVQVLLGLDHEQAGHQLGDRGDRQGDGGILFEQHFRAGLVQHIGDRGTQVERIVGTVQAGHVAGAEDGEGRRGAAHALVDHLALAVHHLDPAHHAFAVVVGNDLGQVGALGLDLLDGGRVSLVLAARPPRGPGQAGTSWKWRQPTRA